MEEIEFSQWFFEGRLRQCKNGLSDGLNWLCYFAGSSKSHRENSISFIFLEFPHQVDMKIVVKSSKHFLWYFNALETHSEFPPWIQNTNEASWGNIEHSLSVRNWHTLVSCALASAVF